MTIGQDKDRDFKDKQKFMEIHNDIAIIIAKLGMLGEQEPTSATQKLRDVLNIIHGMIKNKS